MPYNESGEASAKNKRQHMVDLLWRGMGLWSYVGVHGAKEDTEIHKEEW